MFQFSNLFVQKLFICPTNWNNVKLTNEKKISRTPCLISKRIWLPEQILPLQITVPPNINAWYVHDTAPHQISLRAAGVCMCVCSHLLTLKNLFLRHPTSPRAPAGCSAGLKIHGIAGCTVIQGRSRWLRPVLNPSPLYHYRCCNSCLAIC